MEKIWRVDYKKIQLFAKAINLAIISTTEVPPFILWLKTLYKLLQVYAHRITYIQMTHTLHHQTVYEGLIHIMRYNGQ